MALRTIHIIICCLTLALTLSGCKPESGAANPRYNSNSTPTADFKEEIRYIMDWNEMLYYHIKHRVVGPPVAARMYGYMGLTVYESLVGGMPDHQTMGGQLNDFTPPPANDPTQSYDWPSVLIEALYHVGDEMLSRFLSGNDTTLAGLYRRHKAERTAAVGAELADRSRLYGFDIAMHIIKWALEDGYDGSRYKFYKTPPRTNHPEYWEPTDFNMKALEPFWPQLRPFAIDSANVCPAPLLHPYSEDTASGFYKQAVAVYEADAQLSEEQRMDALYWADCPGETATPPGHWSFILGYVALEHDMNLAEAAEMYCLAGIGIADAFIQCWHTKYDINLVRPKTYIREVLGHEGWEPYVITPPFPEYVSGHSTVSGCAAELLTLLLGDEVGFTDSTHVRIGLGARRYSSFREAAAQAANSRLYGGMHYPMANDEGVRQGKCVAEKIWKKLKFKAEVGS